MCFEKILGAPWHKKRKRKKVSRVASSETETCLETNVQYIFQGTDGKQTGGIHCCWPFMFATAARCRVCL